jgi:hypothetical protein
MNHFSDMGASVVMGVPQNGWFIRENPNLKWIIWGYPYFRKPPYITSVSGVISPFITG